MNAEGSLGAFLFRWYEVTEFFRAMTIRRSYAGRYANAQKATGYGALSAHQCTSEAEAP